jgi:hypothetical protein
VQHCLNTACHSYSCRFAHPGGAAAAGAYAGAIGANANCASPLPHPHQPCVFTPCFSPRVHVSANQVLLLDNNSSMRIGYEEPWSRLTALTHLSLSSCATLLGEGVYLRQLLGLQRLGAADNGRADLSWCIRGCTALKVSQGLGSVKGGLHTKWSHHCYVVICFFFHTCGTR